MAYDQQIISCRVGFQVWGGQKVFVTFAQRFSEITTDTAVLMSRKAAWMTLVWTKMNEAKDAGALKAQPFSVRGGGITTRHDWEDRAANREACEGALYNCRSISAYAAEGPNQKNKPFRIATIYGNLPCNSTFLSYLQPLAVAQKVVSRNTSTGVETLISATEGSARLTARAVDGSVTPVT